MLFWQSLCLHPTIILRYLRTHLHKFNRQLGLLSLLRPDAESEITVISFIAEISWPVESHLHTLIYNLRGWHLEGSRPFPVCHILCPQALPSSNNQRQSRCSRLNHVIRCSLFVVHVSVTKAFLPIISYKCSST